MTENPRQNELLESVLAESHRTTRRRTPEFAQLWSRAVARAKPARAARGRRFALAAAGLALVAIVAMGVWTAGRQSRSELDRAMTIAASVGEWQAPLDFLLATPGREWLATTPSLDPNPDAVPWAVAPDFLQEVVQ